MSLTVYPQGSLAWAIMKKNQRHIPHPRHWLRGPGPHFVCRTLLGVELGATECHANYSHPTDSAHLHWKAV